MYVSVFFGVLPTIQQTTFQMKCIVSQYRARAKVTCCTVSLIVTFICGWMTVLVNELFYKYIFSLTNHNGRWH